jgi:hypothetical protein
MCRDPITSIPSLPLAPPMLFSTGVLQCSPCPSGLYSLQQGALHGGRVINSNMCSPCPPGADCMAGGDKLKAKPNFWGFNDSVDTVSFLQCPRDYCCHNEKSMHLVTGVARMHVRASAIQTFRCAVLAVLGSVRQSTARCALKITSAASITALVRCYFISS